MRLGTIATYLLVGIMVFAVFLPLFSEYAEAQTTYMSTCGTSFALCSEGNTPQEAEAFCNANCAGSCTAAVEGTCTGAATALAETVGETAVTWAAGKLLEGVVAIIRGINGMLVWLVSLVAQLLDAAINISLAGLSGINAIQIGWEIVRDVANLFFIFALLAIAIATILRLEQYGAKTLLARLIVIALLINFSLVIAAGVVDASNILALAFIDAIHPVSDSIVASLSIGKMRFPDTGSVEWREVSLDEVLSAGWPNALSVQSMEFVKDGDAFEAASFGAAPNPKDATLAEFFFQVTILILELVLVFVFVSLAAMLLIRSVALIVIFVLAPLGFLAGVFPQTRGFSTQWWQKLFHWSFFFPAMAFMIYLAVTYGAQMALLFPDNSSQTMNTGLLFNYFVTVALLIGSLLVARQMGIIGASAAIGLGLGMARRARGYAGRVSTAGLRAGVRPLTAGAAAAAGAALGTAAARRIAQIPVLRQALRPAARLTEARQQRAKDEAKRISNLSSKQQATMIHTLRADAQAEAFDAMNDKRKGEMVREMNSGMQMRFYERMARFDLEKDVAKSTNNLHGAMQMQYAQYRGPENKKPPENNKEYQQRVNDYLGGLSAEQMRKMDAESIGENKYFMKYFAVNARNFNDVTNSREQINATQKMLFGMAKNFGIEVNQSLTQIASDLAKELDKKGNQQLARQLRGSIGVNLLVNPESVGVRSKRGNIQVGAPQQQGEG